MIATEGRASERQLDNGCGCATKASPAYAFVAQLVEHLSEEQRVTGSNPVEGTVTVIERF